ncbi:MAG: zinc metalloprotease HtpX [Legionellales bacterium]|nr:zinc metalloprotease HtpX [Legionellales bacterium]
MVDRSQFQVGSTDWRAQIRKNQRRTRWVIGIFIGLYVLLGLLIDTFIYGEMYAQYPYQAILKALLTGYLVPYVTMITSAIAVLSLLITYAFHNRIVLLGTEYYEVTPETERDLTDKQLYHVVEELKIAAGLSYMPRIYLIEAPYMNAFASGYSEKSAMVAITRGLLEKLSRAELQAVMAHEISHIRHGDIKLTLMVAVLSNLMLIMVDLLFYAVLFNPRRQSRGDNRLVIVIILLRYLLPLITVLLGLFLSRTREYLADAGCVQLTRNNEPLASALIKIHEDHQQNAEQYRYEYAHTAHEEVRRAAYVYDPAKALGPIQSFSGAFSTHPRLGDRLKALGVKLKENNK